MSADAAVSGIVADAAAAAAAGEFEPTGSGSCPGGYMTARMIYPAAAAAAVTATIAAAVAAAAAAADGLAARRKKLNCNSRFLAVQSLNTAAATFTIR